MLFCIQYGSFQIDLLYLLVFFLGKSTFHRDALSQHHVAWKLDI